MDIIVRANRKQFEEAKNMCDALRELFADELENARHEAQAEINAMNIKLSELGRTDDILKAAREPEYQEQLLKEFHLV